MQKMAIVHIVDEGDAASKISNDQSNVRKPAVFCSASNTEQELFIHQDCSLFNE